MRKAPFLVAISLVAAFGNWNDTSTGIDLDKLPHFPLTKIRSGWLKAGARVTFDGINVVAADGDVRLSSASKSGKRWEAHIFGIDEVWRGDLDGNGTQDYVLFAAGPYGNGRTAPSYSLSFLLMDRDGLPVPFFTVLYKGENGDGSKYLVDLNRDGHAQLLISDYDELASDAYVGPFCSGHWVSQLYRFTDLGMEEIHRTAGGIHFPFIHNWSYRGTECPKEPKPFSKIESPVLPNHETAQRGLGSAIRSRVDGNDLIAVGPADGCRKVKAALMVYDTPQIRLIAFPNLFDEYAETLASKIRTNRTPGGTSRPRQARR